MTISSFDDLLSSARAQSEHKCSAGLFVFTTAGVPDDATAQQRTRFDTGRGGTLTPLMCVDKAPEDLTSFEMLLAESRQFDRAWDIVFVAALAGAAAAAPTAAMTEAALERMVESIKSGEINRYIPFDVHGRTVRFLPDHRRQRFPPLHQAQAADRASATVTMEPTVNSAAASAMRRRARAYCTSGVSAASRSTPSTRACAGQQLQVLAQRGRRRPAGAAPCATAPRTASNGWRHAGLARQHLDHVQAEAAVHQARQHADLGLAEQLARELGRAVVAVSQPSVAALLRRSGSWTARAAAAAKRSLAAAVVAAHVEQAGLGALAQRDDVDARRHREQDVAHAHPLAGARSAPRARRGGGGRPLRTARAAAARGRAAPRSRRSRLR